MLPQVCTVKNHVSVYAYSCGSLRALGAFTGNENRSSYYIKAKLSPDGSLLASGATDDALCLWNVDCPGPPVARLTVSASMLLPALPWCLPCCFLREALASSKVLRLGEMLKL